MASLEEEPTCIDELLVGGGATASAFFPLWPPALLSWERWRSAVLSWERRAASVWLRLRVATSSQQDVHAGLSIEPATNIEAEVAPPTDRDLLSHLAGAELHPLQRDELGLAILVVLVDVLAA